MKYSHFRTILRCALTLFTLAAASCSVGDSNESAAASFAKITPEPNALALNVVLHPEEHCGAFDEKPHPLRLALAAYHEATGVTPIEDIELLHANDKSVFRSDTTQGYTRYPEFRITTLDTRVRDLPLKEALLIGNIQIGGDGRPMYIWLEAPSDLSEDERMEREDLQQRLVLDFKFSLIEQLTQVPSESGYFLDVDVVLLDEEPDIAIQFEERAQTELKTKTLVGMCTGFVGAWTSQSTVFNTFNVTANGQESCAKLQEQRINCTAYLNSILWGAGNAAYPYIKQKLSNARVYLSHAFANDCGDSSSPIEVGTYEVVQKRLTSK